MSSARNRETVRKHRLLALHGYQQDAPVFRAKTGALRKALRQVADLHYLDAPHEATPGLAWWRSSDDGTEYRGFTESLAHVRAYMAAEGPFDGVLGFSQGGVFASILGALGAARVAEAPELHDLRYAIMVSAFASRADAHKRRRWYGAVALPSLHVWGTGDAIVPATASAALAGRFADAETLTHKGGHVVPGTRDAVQAVASFISSVENRGPRDVTRRE